MRYSGHKPCKEPKLYSPKFSYKITECIHLLQLLKIGDPAAGPLFTDTKELMNPYQSRYVSHSIRFFSVVIFEYDTITSTSSSPMNGQVGSSSGIFYVVPEGV